MSMNDSSNIKEGLERYFHVIIQAKDNRSCYIGIYDYIQYIVSNSIFDPTVDGFGKDKHQSNVKLNATSTLFRNELNLAEKEILQITLKCKLSGKDIDQLKKRIDFFNQVSKKEGGNESLEYKYKLLTQVLEGLHSNGFDKQVTKYFKTGDCTFSDYGFSIIYTDYINAKESLKDTRLVSLWSCWDELMAIHSAIALTENEECPNIQGVYFALSIANASEVVRGNKSKRVKIEETKLWVNRVHNHIVLELSAVLSGGPEVKTRVSENKNNSKSTKPVVSKITLVTLQKANFDRYFLIFNDEYEIFYEMPLRRKDGTNYKASNQLLDLCERKKVSFDRNFYSYMRHKIFQIKVFKKYEPTQLLKSEKKNLIPNNIEIKVVSIQQLSKDIADIFPKK